MPKQHDSSDARDAAAQRAATDDVSQEWQVGDCILNLYDVTGILGQGGMGKVYKVYHRNWKVDLAVKSPRPTIFDREDGKANFIREAETWINLGLHPHIVSCYYVRTLRGIPRVFAEYMAGGSLADWIRKRRLYDDGREQALERMLDVAIQFAWGLGYAHQQGLVHRDVKPANLMMTPEGIAKVTDFGLAKAQRMAGEAGVSGEGMTPVYRSPEQANRQSLSHTTDIWSWGVSLLEMFVGSFTWMDGVAAREVLASHEAQDPAVPEMPTEVVKLLARCFQPRPEDRPASMQEVAAALQEIYQHEVGQPYPRPVPKVAGALADTLNNRALSLLDLGKAEEAKQVWEQALKVDPQHLETIYNRGVMLWREGTLTDDIVVSQLESARAVQSERWQTAYFLAQVHLERGDVDTALPLLKKAAQQAPAGTEVQALLERVQLGNSATIRRLHTFQEHTGSMRSVSLSADGHLAFSGGVDGTVRLWETNTERCLRIFQAHTGSVLSVSLSADGYLALSGGEDGTMRLWETSTGRCLRVFEGHMGGVLSVSLSADGRLVLSGGEDGTMRLWETSTGRCLRIFQAHTNWVWSVSLSADGRVALSGGDDATVRLWETSTGRCLHVFEGHTGSVRSVSLSADGHLALSGGDKRSTGRLWETSTGRCLHIFEGHAAVRSVSLSADGRVALSGGDDATVRLWETSTGRCLHVFEGHTGSVQSVSLSADGHLALSGGVDGTVRLWETSTGRNLWKFDVDRYDNGRSISRAGRVFIRGYRTDDMLLLSVSLSADGRVALSGGEDGTVRLWETSTGRCLRVFEGHTDFVSSVSLSAEGNLALLGIWESQDQPLHLWETSTGRCLRTFQEINPYVFSVGLSANGSLALSSSFSPNLLLRETSTGRLLRGFQGHTDFVRSVSLSADGRVALSGGDDGTMRLWETSTGRCLRTFREHAGSVGSVSLSADGRLAISGGVDGTMRLWELPRESLEACPPWLSGLRSYATLMQVETQAGALLQRAESALAAGSHVTALTLVQEVRQLPGWKHSPQTLEVWRKLARFFPRKEFRAAWLVRTLDKKVVNSLSLSADGRLTLSSGGDGAMRLWETSTGLLLRVFEGHTNWVWSVSLSADGRLALSGGEDGTMRLWETKTGRCLRIFQQRMGSMYSVSLSADGHLALSGGKDGTVRLWETSTGRYLRVFEAHTGLVRSVSLSADGHLALSGGDDATVRLWETSTGRCLHVFRGDTGSVYSVSLSADGRLALSGGHGTTVRLWETSTGRCLHIFREHTHWVQSVSLSADGHLALSGSMDGTVRLWELDWELEARERTDWDEDAQSYLELFLTQHTPYVGVLPQDRLPSEWEIHQALTRGGRPSWNEQDFQELIRQLQDAGYGWLRPEGVRRKLQEMAASRQDPRLLIPTLQVRKPSLWSRLFHSS